MNNYEYCAAWAESHCQPEGKILDFGCGGAETVTLLRARGFDAIGCDVYYEGGDLSSRVPAETRPYIARMDGQRIPFPDASFDVVLSNQVMEHVPNFLAVSAEIARVLKPGGASLHLFPDRSIWREGHCELPFLHWFPKGSTPRVYYAAALRAIGLGARHEAGRTCLEWGRYFCAWLDQWTHYRTVEEVHDGFRAHFASLEHIEPQWITTRFPRTGLLPLPLQHFIARKWGGMAIELQR